MTPISLHEGKSDVGKPKPSLSEDCILGKCLPEVTITVKTKVKKNKTYFQRFEIGLTEVMVFDKWRLKVS